MNTSSVKFFTSKPIILTVDQVLGIVTSKKSAMNVTALAALLHILVRKLNIGNEKVELVDADGFQLKELIEDDNERMQITAFTINSKNPAEKVQMEIKEEPGDIIYQISTNSREKQDLEEKQLRNEDLAKYDKIRLHKSIESYVCEETQKNRIAVLEDLLKTNTERLQNMQCEISELYSLQEEVKRIYNHEFLRKIMDECQKCRNDGPETPFCVDYSNPFNEVVLGLLSNKTFLVEMMKRISCPILDKISNWENQLKVMEELFQKFIQKSEEEFAKLPTPEMNAKATSKLREEFEAAMREFCSSMQEIQEMLDAKLDKIHVVALKKFIVKEFCAIYDEIDMLRKNEDCPDAVATSKGVLENVKCLTCTGVVCQRRKPHKASVFRKFRESKIKTEKTQLAKNMPFVPLPGNRICGGKHTVIKPDERVFRAGNLADEFGAKIWQAKVNFGRGRDGNMYRIDPDIPVHGCKKPSYACSCSGQDITGTF